MGGRGTSRMSYFMTFKKESGNYHMERTQGKKNMSNCNVDCLDHASASFCSYQWKFLHTGEELTEHHVIQLN